jgi:hypothetical protein
VKWLTTTTIITTNNIIPFYDDDPKLALQLLWNNSGVWKLYGGNDTDAMNLLYQK